MNAVPAAMKCWIHEGPQWRGIFLSAARELREGVPAAFATASPDTILAMPIDILFDFVAVHLKGPEAADADLTITLDFTDQDQVWTMRVARGVLNARRGAVDDAQLTVAGPKAALVGVLLQPAAATRLAEAGTISLEGDQAALRSLGELIDEFDPNFNVITP